MSSNLSLSERLQVALDLNESGVEMMKMNLHRRHKGSDEAAITAMLHRWQETRPGAEDGDGAGRPVQWPRP